MVLSTGSTVTPNLEIAMADTKGGQKIDWDGLTKAVRGATKAGDGIDWDGLGKLLVSDTARKEFANLRRAFTDVNQQLQTKFSMEPKPIDWEYYKKGIGENLVNVYKQGYETSSPCHLIPRSFLAACSPPPPPPVTTEVRSNRLTSAFSCHISLFGRNATSSVDSMGLPILALNSRTSHANSPDVYPSQMNSSIASNRLFASVSMEENKQKPIDFLRILFEGIIAGGTAGVVVETALYPIDTIKTRLQAAHGGAKIHWKGLYSGLAGNLAGVLPASALFVGVYEPAKQKLLTMFPENLSAFAHLSAGAIGGLAASLIRVPTEVVKQRMQTGQFSSAPDAVRLILSKEGSKGLFAGYGSFLLRDLPFDAIQFCIYEQMRIGYKTAAKRDLTDPENAVIGAFAGAVTGAITTPLDVLKTRLMVQGNQYNGIINCAQTIVREEGPAAFLKGIGPRVLWIGIGGSIFFGILERTKLLLSEQRSKSESLKEE